MGSIITIINILGSLTSIYAFIHSIKLKDSIRNMVTYGILLLTSVISGVCFYLYHQETDTKIQYEKQKETVRLEAKNLLENVPSSIDYYNPGENEGLLLSTLALLERNKDIFPETYEAYKLEVIQKMKNADNESDIFRKREQMEIAGNSAIRLLKSLAQ